MKNNEKEDLWKELNDDSYIWACLRNYRNTILGYSDGVSLLKKIWYKKYSNPAPEAFITDEKYSKKYQECLKEIEKYISKKFGRNVKIRYVEDIVYKCNRFFYFLSKDEDMDRQDFWVIEVKNS